MKPLPLLCCGFAISCAAARSSAGQDTIPWPPANRLAVVVTARVMQTRADTVAIVYTIGNELASEQAAATFAVRAFVTEYELSAPPQWLESPGVIQDSSAAAWVSLGAGADVEPGESMDGFGFEAVGLPDIVAYRVQGHYNPPVYSEEEFRVIARPLSFWANSVAGHTVGLAPLPVGVPLGTLIARLEAFSARSCADLAWITSAGVCHSLQVKLDSAQSALATGNTEVAKGNLQAFLNELEAQHGPEPGKHVSDNAYWLLKVNAEYILGRL